ncbi:MAG: hypothetical protein KGL44_00870 [Sphingomonadales bacterium]|nr:hypothetical protein [Sphingomonadales bacterium]
MIVRAGTGWQTTLTDLSLILFMICASALSQAEDAPRRAPGKPAQASPRSEPTGVWRAVPGAPPLGEWLAGQPADPRQIVTILAPYAPGGQSRAVALAGELARAAEAQQRTVRLLVEPGADAATVTLGYDQPDMMLARGLQSVPARQPASQGPPT